jgi:hypothetical protein
VATSRGERGLAGTAFADRVMMLDSEGEEKAGVEAVTAVKKSAVGIV